MLTRALVCGAMGLARLLELVHSQRNLAKQGAVEEGEGSRRTFPIMVALFGIERMNGSCFARHMMSPT